MFASIGGKVMAQHTSWGKPRGLIADDAGGGLNNFGFSGIYTVQAAKDVSEWPRRAAHTDSQRTNRTGKSLANGGYGLLGMRQTGCRTRPELLVCGGAPRRNRTGDPILTMNLALTAVQTSASAGRRRP
jgi:hypothetical protein